MWSLFAYMYKGMNLTICLLYNATQKCNYVLMTYYFSVIILASLLVCPMLGCRHS